LGSIQEGEETQKDGEVRYKGGGKQGEQLSGNVSIVGTWGPRSYHKHGDAYLHAPILTATSAEARTCFNKEKKKEKKKGRGGKRRITIPEKWTEAITSAGVLRPVLGAGQFWRASKGDHERAKEDGTRGGSRGGFEGEML